MDLMLAATDKHETCYEIGDDLALLHETQRNTISTPFRKYMREMYDQGGIPQKWHG